MQPDRALTVLVEVHENLVPLDTRQHALEAAAAVDQLGRLDLGS
jgi:hypothetical protein